MPVLLPLQQTVGSLRRRNPNCKYTVSGGIHRSFCSESVEGTQSLFFFKYTESGGIHGDSSFEYSFTLIDFYFKAEGSNDYTSKTYGIFASYPFSPKVNEKYNIMISKYNCLKEMVIVNGLGTVHSFNLWAKLLANGPLMTVL